MTDRVRIDALRSSLTSASPRDVDADAALRSRCCGHDDLAWALGVASLTRWHVVSLPETSDPGLPFAVLDPSGRALLPWKTLDLTPHEVSALTEHDEPVVTIDHVDERLGGAARGRHAVAEAAVDALRLYGDDLWPHVVSVPDGIEGKVEEVMGVPDRSAEGPPAWLAEAVAGVRDDRGNDACVELIRLLQQLLKTTEGQAEVGRALAAADVTIASDLLRTTLLRMTCQHRDVLGESWYGFRDRARDAWSAEGRNVSKVMLGLLDDRPASGRGRSAGIIDWSTLSMRITHLAPLDGIVDDAITEPASRP